MTLVPARDTLAVMSRRKHFDFNAIADGARALLLAYPNKPADPKPPRGAHMPFWLDDWDRGVVLAREACDRALASLGRNLWPPSEDARRRACAKVARLALVAPVIPLPPELEVILQAEVCVTDEQFTALESWEVDAWEQLCVLIANIEKRADLEQAHEGEFDEEIDRDEVERV